MYIIHPFPDPCLNVPASDVVMVIAAPQTCIQMSGAIQHDYYSCL